MTTLREAAQQAIADICAARLCEVNSMSSRQEMLRLMIRATDTLRRALEQPEQEPVAWICTDEEMRHRDPRWGRIKWIDGSSEDELAGNFLYAAPLRREWQSLSLREIAKALADAGLQPEDYREDGQILPLVRAIEQALKERNHG